MTAPTLEECIKLHNDLNALKNRARTLYRRSQQIGFPEGYHEDDPLYQVTPRIGNVMCDIDEAVGALREYIDEAFPGQVHEVGR